MSSTFLWIAVLSLGASAEPLPAISSGAYGIRLPVPRGWTSRVTDTSLTVSSNTERDSHTVVVGVQFSPNLSPYATEKDWREQTMSAFLRYLQSNYGRLLTPNSKGTFRGDSTENANYLALDPKSRLLFAGQSRFLAKDGKGYELFVMGDTTPLYTDFPKYEAILESMEWGTSSLRAEARTKNGIHVERAGGTELVVRSTTPLTDLRLLDVRGREVEARIERPDPFVARILPGTRPGGALVLGVGSETFLILP